MNLNIFIEQVFGALKTEKIFDFLSGLDPLKFFKDPYYLAGFIAIGLVLFLLRYRKTLVFLGGLLAFWYASFHFLPKGEELKLDDLLTFGITCFGIMATWIYHFFIKGD